MKYFKKLFKVLIWPIILIIGQFLIQYIFIYAFNLKEISNNPNTNINKLIKTVSYKNRLNEYINSRTVLILTILFIIIVPIMYSVFKKYKTKNKLKINNIFTIIIIGVSISLIYNILMFNLNNIFKLTDQFKLNKLPIYAQIISSGIIGPILEELTFRGVVYNKLKEFNKPMKSIVLTSIIFSIIHTNFINMLYAFIISFMFIYVYEKYKTLKAPIILHMVSNITVIVLLPIILKDSFINYIILFISLILLILVYFKIIRKDVYSFK